MIHVIYSPVAQASAKKTLVVESGTLMSYLPVYAEYRNDPLYGKVDLEVRGTTAWLRDCPFNTSVSFGSIELLQSVLNRLHSRQMDSVISGLQKELAEAVAAEKRDQTMRIYTTVYEHMDAIRVLKGRLTAARRSLVHELKFLRLRNLATARGSRLGFTFSNSAIAYMVTRGLSLSDVEQAICANSYKSWDGSHIHTDGGVSLRCAQTIDGIHVLKVISAACIRSKPIKCVINRKP
jgi:hypothetical protein